MTYVLKIHQKHAEHLEMLHVKSKRVINCIYLHSLSLLLFFHSEYRQRDCSCERHIWDTGAG